MLEIDSAYQRLRIDEKDGVRILKFTRNEQSSMHLDDPFQTDIEYIGYLHTTVAVKPTATRTLIIGLGGGSLVKRMWRDYPWMHIDAVEIDPRVVEVARRYFALPDDERIRVIVSEGREFISAAPDVYDIIVVDAFADDRVPRPLLTEEFMLECRAHLAEDGVIAWNVIGAVQGRHSKQFRSFHRTAANVWRHVWTFEVRSTVALVIGDTRNLVMLASDARLTDDELLERIGSRVGGLVTVPAFERFAEDLYPEGMRTGDVPILYDEPRPRKRWLR